MKKITQENLEVKQTSYYEPDEVKPGIKFENYTDGDLLDLIDVLKLTDGDYVLIYGKCNSPEYVMRIPTLKEFLIKPRLDDDELVIR